jgi:hypothetical protein
MNTKRSKRKTNDNGEKKVVDTEPVAESDGQWPIHFAQTPIPARGRLQ